jgi:hypothetical protein
MLFLISYNTLDVSFPFFKYASNSINERLVPSEPFDNIAAAVSRFMWDYKSLDLIAQAFVLLAAVICSIALMKQEGI